MQRVTEEQGKKEELLRPKDNYVRTEAELAPKHGAPSGVEVEQSSDLREYDFDIDPRMLTAVEKAGPATDTIPVPVHNKNPSKVLKIDRSLAAS